MRSVKTSFKIAILVSILGFSQIGHAGTDRAKLCGTDRGLRHFFGRSKWLRYWILVEYFNPR